MWIAGTRVADTRVVDTLLATLQGLTLTLSQTAPPGGCSDSPLTGGMLGEVPLEHVLHHGDGLGDVLVFWTLPKTRSDSAEVPLQYSHSQHKKC